MTPIDDINVGDTIAVVGCKMQHRLKDFTGIPHTVIAISLPFLALDDGGIVRTLDVRVWEVKKVGRHYVEVMNGGDGERQRRVKKEKPDPMSCRNCGDRFCERLFGRTWRWWCRTCHTEGGPVNKAPNPD